MKVLILLLVGSGLAACGSPKDEYFKAIEDQGYIPYVTPLDSAGVGTIIKGKPEAMRVATRPERCFPNYSREGNETELRWVAKTKLPSVYKRFQMSVEGGLNDMLAGGNFILSLEASFERDRQVEITFDGASIEYLDEYNLYYYYNYEMNGFCKELLSETPFILQALRIEKMSFRFMESSGANVRLSPGMVGDLLQIGVGTNWKIKNNLELVIESPKYIGYQVGFLDPNGPGKIAYLAHKLTKNGDFDYEQVSGGVPIPVKPNPDQDQYLPDELIFD